MNLKELASRLGLSPTTVSRALNGYPEVNEATRERVMAAAKRHNYHPNTRAIRLATGRAMAIGHVIPVATRHEIVNPVFADFIAGAGETYSRNDYDMVLSVVPDEQEEAAYRGMKSKGNVDGVIVHAPKMNDARIGLLHDIGLPFVVHGRATGTTLPYSWLDVNNRRAFQRATEFLLDLGHTRIALVNGLEFMDFAIRRRTGYIDALSTRGIAPEPALMSSDEMTEIAGHRTARRMLALSTPPTAFLVASMISGMGVRRALEEQGLQMGRDISVIIHDDDLSYMKNGDDVPIFTATRSSVRDAGRLAAEMLLDMIASPGPGPQQRLLEAELIMGQSTGPCLKP
ncbi:MAG: substrate-binding domain-containing protein [Pseudotabrizicola sp.]|uniref:substrate-binding domain-containing protein n=1 Tax=Pseudotabrizicola sp. TaxID=2939647 RepID=UPI002719D646|nr:substrate-binding domain-containing protein [Pseudotabrizicola sp.]MDO8884490.1 substrate-binding domain-containing protein [Pseudotabrizicola sp.]MDP2082686.1 substrate-binding domain-containing protein [Pseudotabrizicola sp.]MDZ7573582.1 substrate-binding domain-containing protein [Pseudotabrizicola sp.]